MAISEKNCENPVYQKKKMLTKIRKKTNNKYFIIEKHFECTKPSDVFQMSNLVFYVQRK